MNIVPAILKCHMEHNPHCRKCRMLLTNLKTPRNFMVAWLQCVEISDDDALKKLLLIYWTICCLLEQQNQEFHSNREN